MIKKVTLLRLQDSYLCPGDENGAHITDSSIMCPCGNTSLASLAGILDREVNKPRELAEHALIEVENGYARLVCNEHFPKVKWQ